MRLQERLSLPFIAQSQRSTTTRDSLRHGTPLNTDSSIVAEKGYKSCFPQLHDDLCWCYRRTFSRLQIIRKDSACIQLEGPAATEHFVVSKVLMSGVMLSGFVQPLRLVPARPRGAIKV